MLGGVLSRVLGIFTKGAWNHNNSPWHCKTCCCVHCTCAWSFDVHRTSRSDSLRTHAQTRVRRRSDSKTRLQRRSGKTAPTLCRTIIQLQLSNVNVCLLNTLICAPTAPSRISLFGLPLARTILPHSLARSLSLTQSTFYPDYSTIFPHSHRVSLIWLFGVLFPYQMLPITIKY